MASINQENLRNQTREQIVDFVLEVIIKNGTYSLDKHKRIIDESGNIVFGNQSQDAVVIYQQDFQEAPNSGKFTELIDNITDCFWDAETSTYREPSIDMFRWLEPGEILPGGNTYPYPIVLPEIAYDGSNPFSVKKSIKAKLSIKANNFSELLRPRGSSGLRYIDLALKTGKAVKEKTGDPELDFRIKALIG